MPVKVGISFGCFIPLHSGHIAMLNRAMDENDRLIIGVTGYDMDRGRDFVPFLRRVELMQQIYRENPRVAVARVDDRELGLTGTFSEEAWRIWSGELFQSAGYYPQDWHCQYTWYTGDQSYIDKLKLVYPKHAFVKLDRSEIPISGTDVREEPEKYRKYIHPEFVKYLEINGFLEPRI